MQWARIRYCMESYLHNCLIIFISSTAPPTPWSWDKCCSCSGSPEAWILVRRKSSRFCFQCPDIIHLLYPDSLFPCVHAWLSLAVMPRHLDLTFYWINSGLSAQAINFGLSLMFCFGSTFSLPLALVSLAQTTLPGISEPALPSEISGTAYLGERQALCLLLTLQRRLGHSLCPQETCLLVAVRGTEIHRLSHVISAV